MKNCNVFTFSAHASKEYGSLVAIEGMQDVPFDIKRIYYIYDVPAHQRRGFHAHEDLEQVLICVSGEVKLLLKTPFEEEVVHLDSPTKALYIGSMIWREMFDWSDDAVLLVLASKHYSEEDYIRNYSDYEQKALDHKELK